MTFLRNTWYVAMWGEALVADDLVPRTLLNEPIVFLRDANGVAHALADYCPHRFAPLHRGALKQEGGETRLHCAYHGLAFSTGGACVHNPHGRLPKASVQSYPLVERHSLLWIWMGDPARADADLIPEFDMLDEDADVQISTRDHLLMKASWKLITDNLLDLSHVSFLHEGILGNEDTIPAEIEVENDGDGQGSRVWVRRLMTGVTVPGLFDLLFRRDGGRVDLWNDMRWDAPGCMRNDAGVTDPGGARADGTGIFGTHFLTPETDRTTWYHFAAVRQNPIAAPPDIAEDLRVKLSELRRIAFAEQDAPMIEAQQVRLDSAHAAGATPVLLAIDKGPAAYKRVMDGLIAAER